MSTPPQRSIPRQEPDRVSGKAAAAWWIGTFLALVAITGVALVAVHVARPHPGSPGGVPPLSLAVPPSRSSPYDAGVHRTAPDPLARARLESYRWLDRDAGRLSIPIDEAMRLVAGAEADR
jgi:hypothetical protein